MPLKVSYNWNRLINEKPDFKYVAMQLINRRYYIRVFDKITKREYEGNLTDIPLKYLFWIIYYKYSSNPNNNNNINNAMNINDNNFTSKLNNMTNNNLKNHFKNLVKNRNSFIKGKVNT